MKIWRVALHEYKRNVFKKSFIFVLLSVPLMIGFTVALGIFMESQGINTEPVGYVDLAGLFDNPMPLEDVSPSRAVEFVPFESEDDALRELEAGELQAYYVVPTDYFETTRVELKYLEEPGKNATRQFYDFIQLNLLSDHPPEIAHLATGGTSVSVRSADGSRFLPGGEMSLATALPLLVGVAFAVLLVMSSGFIMQAVADEKENRTMEVLVTSLSPAKLIGGKILGVIAISLTQLIVWVAFAVLGVFIATYAGVEGLDDLDIDWGSVLATVGVGLPAYAVAAGLMAAIGATVTNVQEGQSVGAVFFTLHMIPIYLAMVVLETPNAPLPIALTFAPFTGLLTISMRQIFTTIPLRQVAAVIAVNAVYAAGALWLAGRALRLGMLRYGQRLRWRELLQRNAS